MNRIIPPKLQRGDTIRVIAPASSLAIISQDLRAAANQRFAEMGLHLTFGRHVEERDSFSSSSIGARIADLHDAFSDPTVNAVLTVIGGYSSNQLLRSIDREIIRRNPKIFCGYSDITALGAAMLAKTGLVSYSGPHYTSFGQKLHFDYTLTEFTRCLISDGPYSITPSRAWSDDHWYRDQDARTLVPNVGYLVLHEGAAEGKLIGGNLCTLNLLQGTEYMPSLGDSILFLEDDAESGFRSFDRDLQSLLHLPDFGGVRGLVIGRFQRESRMTDDLLRQIIQSKRELDHLPVLANVDFGHTDPKITFPIGGTVRLQAGVHSAITILEH